ncbi:MAG: hypothetical protein J2P17_00325 [Mycobacterium sp.]|nr:hypothetical protein [Mycobacterium sp.]
MLERARIPVMSLNCPTPPDLLTHTFLAMESVAADPSDLYFGVLLRCSGGAPSLSELRAHVKSRIAMVPALTHRLTSGPAWEADPEFDIRSHVRMLSAGPVEAAPIREWMPAPPSHDHPLWRMWLLPGAGSEWGLAFAVHHAVLDGTGVMRALEVLFAGREASAVGEPAGNALSAVRAVPNVLRTFRSAPDLTVMGSLTGQRRLDSTTVPMADLRAIADASGGSVGKCT